ncbi:similar to An02g04010 [Aspergillus luchuensis]|uniref:Similar to An02g04010 n=1 Tax=Aspergillus kawachii TaxID=1069201 RepID=A0A146FND3_ASPKA|nr:similar to An02g04010 [Aspergillus luchuensis]
MSRRRASHSESLGISSTMNEALAYPFSGMQQSNAPQRRGPIEGPNGRRLIRRVTWRSSTYKLMACLWVLGVFYIVWLIRDVFYYPFYASSKQPLTPKDTNDLLAPYVGRQECDISSLSLFSPPQPGDGERASSNPYCQSRDALLNAMSNGGRHGFDAAAEVCDILRKFDGIVFVGDDTLADAYAGFNILLREDLATGSLKEWEINKGHGHDCRCESQFTSRSCLPLRITSSDEVYAQEGSSAPRRPYACSSRIPHAFLATASSPAPRGVYDKFRRMVARGVGRNRPVPVILSLSLSTSYSLSTAKSSMDEWLTLAQASGRNTPFLWVGPTAPGLQKDSRDNIHASSWQYSQDTAQEARNRGLDALGMYNATLQADSWDGKHYGEKVALIQAMMVINWLAML